MKAMIVNIQIPTTTTKIIRCSIIYRSMNVAISTTTSVRHSIAWDRLMKMILFIMRRNIYIYTYPEMPATRHHICKIVTLKLVGDRKYADTWAKICAHEYENHLNYLCACVCVCLRFFLAAHTSLHFISSRIWLN